MLVQIAPESKFLKNASVNMKFDGIKLYSYKTHANKKKPSLTFLDNHELYELKKQSTLSLYINYIRLTVIFLLSFFAISEFKKIIFSVKETKTFHYNNILSFRKIGKYLLFISLAMCFYSVSLDDGKSFTLISIPFNTLTLALLVFIMAEIFKEGNNLSEENKLTV